MMIVNDGPFKTSRGCEVDASETNNDIGPGGSKETMFWKVVSFNVLLLNKC